ncbi:MAG: DUF6089 family protein [Saprospiraceae bacterium]|nr:DUF6089 family protein [Saprospiraceae bacterium]
MTKHLLIRLLALPLTLVVLLPAHGQRGWEVGGSLGVSYYFGDLNTSYSLNKPGPAASLNARFNFNTRTSVSFNGSYAYIYADDADSKNDYERTRNLSFASHLADLAATLEFNFLPYRHGSYNESFTPYVLTGFSVFHFNPRAQLNDEWFNLRDFGTEGQQPGNEYFLVSGSWVFGGGFKMDLNRVWSINIEINSHQVFTDYLDDVSTTYPDKTTLRNRRGMTAVLLSDRSIENDQFPELGQEGKQRGDSKDNDSFNIFKVSLMYYFGKVRCPAISQPLW